MMFRSKSAATRHLRITHQTVVAPDGTKKVHTEPKMPSLECADPECKMLCDSMVTLVQHVADAHKGDVEVNDYKFPDLDSFEVFIFFFCRNLIITALESGHGTVDLFKVLQSLRTSFA